MKDIKEIVDRLINEYLRDGNTCFDFIEKTYIKSSFLNLLERDIDESDLYKSYSYISNAYIVLDNFKLIVNSKNYPYYCVFNPYLLDNINEINGLIYEFESILKNEKEKLLTANSNLTTTKRKVKI